VARPLRPFTEAEDEGTEVIESDSRVTDNEK
jgi:hypothetical protein